MKSDAFFFCFSAKQAVFFAENPQKTFEESILLRKIRKLIAGCVVFAKNPQLLKNLCQKSATTLMF